MMQIYKILSSDEHNTTYKFIKEIFPTVTYTLIDANDEVLYTAEDDEDNIKFDKKIGKSFEYHEIADLHLFLNLIQQFDDTLTDTYEVYQKVTTL
jgi:hypothetical protein